MKKNQKSKIKNQKYKSKFKIFLLFNSILSFCLLIFYLSYAEPERDSIAFVEKLFLEEKYERVIYESNVLIDARSRHRDELYYLKGLSELKTNRFKEARQSFESILAKYLRSRRIFDAYLGIGDSYFLEGDASGAILVYKEMLETFPSDGNISIVRNRIEDCYKKITSHSKAEAKTGYIALQIGCFKNKRNASELAQKLSKEGHRSYVELPVGSDERLYRVKIGRFKSKEEAEAAASKLKKAGYDVKICADNV